MEQKINKTDYENLQKFSDAVIALNSVMNQLNHHIEVLKRAGCIDALNDLGANIGRFVYNVIRDFSKNLKDDDQK